MEKKSELISQAQDRKEFAIREAQDRTIAGQIVAAAINSNQLALSDWHLKFDEIYNRLHNPSVGKRTEPEPTEEIPFPIE
jgi:hypothetical protein